MTKKTSVTRKEQAPPGLLARLPFQLTAERMIVGGSILFTLLIVAGIGLSSYLQNYNATRTIDGVQSFPGLVASHVEGTLHYDQSPPAGGPHNPVWQDC